jgi:hypothetical protein
LLFILSLNIEDVALTSTHSAMARAWLEKSIVDGCSSWDKVLLKLLDLVLTSAVTGRAGNVEGSREPRQFTGAMLSLSYRLVFKTDHRV